MINQALVIALGSGCQEYKAVIKQIFRVTIRSIVTALISCCFVGCSSDALAPVQSLTAKSKPTRAVSSNSANVHASSASRLPPVQAISAVNTDHYANAKTYIVKQGDTLYSIAFLAGIDYEQLAQMNQIRPPYTLSIGQILQLKSPVGQQKDHEAASFRTVFWSPKQQSSTRPARAQRQASAPSFQWRPTTQNERVLPTQVQWHWPVRGRILQGFSDKPGANRGIDLAGRPGQPIKAAALGRVVYSGHGVRGYGNMIIIKHSRHFLSAYAFNAKNLVHDGDWVKSGQVIATMGRNLGGVTMLHFEIRSYGKAVNPIRFLPAL